MVTRVPGLHEAHVTMVHRVVGLHEAHVTMVTGVVGLHEVHIAALQCMLLANIWCIWVYLMLLDSSGIKNIFCYKKSPLFYLQKHIKRLKYT